MINRILFSPIGGSDPVNARHDGAWIHCCRHFQPDLTVIYLSKEMLKRENEKKIFSETLNKLCEKIHKNIEIKKEERPHLENPQDFEAFYDDFESILAEYHQKYPEAEILLNVSSGTPAMKGCLIHLYHMLPYPVKLIQVYGPHKEMGMDKGKRETVSEEYDVGRSWEENKDNDEGAINRCHILKDQQQAMRLKVMQLKTLIRHHEYAAALMLAESDELKEFMPVRLLNGLRAAVSRMQMDLRKAGVGFQEFEFEDGKTILAYQNDLLFKGAEMLLTMEIDLQRDDIASCLRKVTPVLFSLIVGYLAKLKFNINDLLDDQGIHLRKDQFQKLYPDAYTAVGCKLFSNKKFPNTCNIDSDSLLKILNYLEPKKTAEKGNISWLRNLEIKVRNEIAHKPEKMTEALFRERTNNSTEEIIKKARKTFELLKPSLFNSSYWRSYERMKNLILDTVAIEK